MTINLSDNNPRVSYAVAQGATQTSFTVSFEFFDNDDLNVYVDGTLKTITTHYTVSGGNGSTGTITMSVTGATGGSTVVITRDIDLDRTTDFPSSGPFNIGALNTELDRLVAIAADLNDLSGRGVKLSDFDTGASLTLPVAADRSNKVLAFNSAGDTLVSQELGTFKGNWAASTAYVERDLVKDTSDGSIYIVNTAHTSSGSLPLDTNTNSSKYSVIFNVDDMVAGNVTASGNFTINGNTTLGNATSDTITATGRFDSSLIPSSSGSNFLGSTSLRWGAAYLNRVEALDSSMTSVFEGSINVKGNVDLGSNGLDTVSVLGSVDSDILPSADNTYDLGGTYKWADVKAVRVTSATLGNPVGNTTIETSSGGGIILDAGNGGIELNTASGTVLIKDEATTYGRLVNTSGNLRLDSGTTTAVTFSGANTTLSGTLDVTGDVTIPDKIVHTGDTNTAIRFPATDTVSFETAGSERFRVASSGQLGIAGTNYGTSGQVLTSGGSSAAPSWTTPLRTKISTTNLSTAAANVGITLPTSGYTYLELHIEGVRPATDEVNFRFELSDDGGSTTETMTQSRLNMNGFYPVVNGFSVTTGTTFQMNGSTITNSTASDFNAIMRINIPTSTTKTSLHYQANFNVGDDGVENNLGCADLRTANVTANFIRFAFSSGNIADGKFTLYGIA